MRAKIWLLGMALAGLTAAAAPARADVWTKSFSFNGKPEFTLNTSEGRVTIVSRNQPGITAHVTATGWKIGQEVKISAQQTGNAADIEIHTPHWNFHFFGSSRNIAIELDVPNSADLDIHTGDGRITCDPVTGNVRLDTGDGSITVTGGSGALRMHSGDGAIEASGLDGTLDASTGDGHIRVSGRFDSLQLRTGDGSVEAGASAGSKIGTGWSVNTGDGSIRLRLPSNFAAYLYAHTGDGEISLDFPVTVSGVINRTTVNGEINGGGGSLRLRTGDGSIHIEKF
jgi:DUF4097 and DUF4098 domain-containing protein YvlB